MRDNLRSLAFFMIGFAIGVLATLSHIESKFAQTECARYHPETGEFEWVKKLDEEK